MAKENGRCLKLPQDLTPKDFDEVFRLNPSQWISTVEEICQLHRIAFSQIHAFSEGSNLVAQIDQKFVVKIFPPFHLHQWISETRVLKVLSKQSLNICIPTLHFEGIREDHWAYVVLDFIPGESVEKVWPSCSFEEKKSLLREIGLLMKKVHETPLHDLQNLEPNWDEFLIHQRRNSFKRHQDQGMPAWMLLEIEEFIRRPCPIPRPNQPVLLTGEYTPFNLLVNSDKKLSGMYDFGDAMIGFEEYDYLGPILFLGEGEADQVNAFYEGYGVKKDPELGQRLMHLAILHRYSHLRAQIKIQDWEKKVGSLAELIKLIQF